MKYSPEYWLFRFGATDRCTFAREVRDIKRHIRKTCWKAYRRNMRLFHSTDNIKQRMEYLNNILQWRSTIHYWIKQLREWFPKEKKE